MLAAIAEWERASGPDRVWWRRDARHRLAEWRRLHREPERAAFQARVSTLTGRPAMNIVVEADTTRHGPARVPLQRPRRRHYDGAEDSRNRSTVGYGATPAAAIADLMALLAETSATTPTGCARGDDRMSDITIEASEAAPSARWSSTPSLIRGRVMRNPQHDGSGEPPRR